MVQTVMANLRVHLAKKLGLDMNKFHGAIESRRHSAQIQADMAAGSAVGAGSYASSAT